MQPCRYYQQSVAWNDFWSSLGLRLEKEGVMDGDNETDKRASVNSGVTRVGDTRGGN